MHAIKIIDYTPPVNGESFSLGIFTPPMPDERTEWQAIADRLAVLQRHHRIQAIVRTPQGPLGEFVAKMLAYRACHQTPCTRRATE